MTWYVTFDSCHVTCDMVHMTCDRLGTWTLSQNLSSLAFAVFEWRFVKDIFTKDKSLNELINNGDLTTIFHCTHTTFQWSAELALCGMSVILTTFICEIRRYFFNTVHIILSICTLQNLVARAIFCATYLQNKAMDSLSGEKKNLTLFCVYCIFFWLICTTKVVYFEKFLEIDQHPQRWPTFKHWYLSWLMSKNLFLLTAGSLWCQLSSLKVLNSSSWKMVTFSGCAIQMSRNLTNFLNLLETFWRIISRFLTKSIHNINESLFQPPKHLNISATLYLVHSALCIVT